MPIDTQRETGASAAVAPDEEIPVRRTTTPARRPSEDTLGFGRHFTDHVFRADFDRARGWHDQRIEPYGPLSLDPAAAVLHYGQAIFEGLKVFRGTDARVRTFRLIDHCRRFARSAEGLAMPPYDPEALASAIEAVVRVDADWIPSGRGTALYLRPMMIATEPFLGVRVADRYTLAVLLSPVAPYFGANTAAVRLWVERRRVRAAPGGIGHLKAAANYAASLPAALEAKQRGYDQVLWLDAVEHRWLEEVGTMNLAVVIGDEIATAPLSGTILAGITRDTVLTLMRDWGLPVNERPISIDEIREAHARGDLREVFGVGTAAIVAPVGTLGFEDGDLRVGDGKAGPVARRLLDGVAALQYGEARDAHGWTRVIA
jgi:branched-chain amino acid aminotransferase